MGSAGEWSLVAALCEWAKVALFWLPDVHRAGVRDTRLWRGSGSRWSVNFVFFIRVFLSWVQKRT